MVKNEKYVKIVKKIKKILQKILIEKKETKTLRS